ncbi:hypothetical protein ROLI_003360 [Roseobacter fucihabitans]|uniref:Transposase n=1 Tax=Roseobacter fucihabitans TaxID=1537242 RepID=A0ABZ2BMG1_9RHOB|nr:transposase [Roseobacter litoralis]MBC6963585.1 hypothetical protein [Roseobacter litoralis]
MNSQTLGALASDQKIQNVFHAFGYSIPVGKDGRRLWPTKFKREMVQRMRSGKLTIGEVQRTCRVCDTTAYKWKKKAGRIATKQNESTEKPTPVFAEIKVPDDKVQSQRPSDPVASRL